MQHKGQVWAQLLLYQHSHCCLCLLHPYNPRYHLFFSSIATPFVGGQTVGVWTKILAVKLGLHCATYSHSSLNSECMVFGHAALGTRSDTPDLDLVIRNKLRLFPEDLAAGGQSVTTTLLIRLGSMLAFCATWRLFAQCGSMSSTPTTVMWAVLQKKKRHHRTWELHRSS